MASDADALLAQVPEVRERFQVVAYAASGSIFPDSTRADALMVGYADATRDAAFRQLQPDRCAQLLLPLSHVDFFNEQRYAPRAVDPKTIDVVYVSPLRPSDEFTSLAEALNILREAAPNLVAHAITTPMDILPILRAAKIFVHLSNDSGKDGMVQQAMACDVPVVTLPIYNTRAYGGGVRDMRSGLTAPTEEPRALAAAMDMTLASYRQFRARDSVLESSGRRYALNLLIDAFPYYAANLPGYERGAHEYSRWIDAAMTACYGTNLHAYLFHDAAPGIGFNGIEAIKALMSDKRLAQCA